MVDADPPVSSSQCLRLTCKVLTVPDPSTENNQSPRVHLCSDCGHDKSGRNLAERPRQRDCLQFSIIGETRDWTVAQPNYSSAGCLSTTQRIKCCIARHHSACWALLYLHWVSHYILYYLLQQNQESLWRGRCWTNPFSFSGSVTLAEENQTIVV